MKCLFAASADLLLQCDGEKVGLTINIVGIGSLICVTRWQCQELWIQGIQFTDLPQSYETFVCKLKMKNKYFLSFGGAGVVTWRAFIELFYHYVRDI